MRVKRPTYTACWMTKVCRAQYLPDELAVLVPEVEQQIKEKKRQKMQAVWATRKATACETPP